MHHVTMIPGLSAIADHYDGIICDVWGVLHNGVVGYTAAAEALRAFRRDGERPVVLLTNAPRPAFEVVQMLDRFGIVPQAYDAIVTSGDVTRALIASEAKRPIYHLGPSRDLPMFEGLDLDLTEAASAEAVVCTGLFDDTVETPEDYRGALEEMAARGLPLYCANPDIVVERGDKLIYCAGALAALYEEMGGTVLMVGKPYKPIYSEALATIDEQAGRPVDKRRVLAIGDAIPTDVRGGFGQGIDVLMVTAGIHAADFGPADHPDPTLVARRLDIEGVAVRAALPRLVW